MKAILAGPWIGEFGHELFNWQSFVRARAHGYDEVIVACSKDHRAIYADFATKFVAVTYDPHVATGSHGKTRRPWRPPAKYAEAEQFSPEMLDPFARQEYVWYGKQVPEQHFDVVVHARAVRVRQGDVVSAKKAARNWPLADWQKLVEHLRAARPELRICSVGTRAAAWHLAGTDYRLDCPLPQLFDVLRSSTLIVGPSSGTMHLATLCRCPQVVWGRNRLRERYRADWNPFETPVCFIRAQDWRPAAQVVAEATLEHLKRWDYRGTIS